MHVMMKKQGTGSIPAITKSLVLDINPDDPLSYDGTTTLKDLSGNGNDMVAPNGFTKDTTGLKLNGSNQYLYRSHESDVSETILVWVKSNTSVWNNNGMISESRRPNGHNMHANSGTTTVGYGIHYDIGWALVGGDDIVVGSYDSAPITQWHMHVVSTENGGLIKCYRDGGLLGTAQNTELRVLQGPQSWRVGSDDLADKGYDGRYLNGSVGIVQRYNKQLTDQEISDLYNTQRTIYGV